MVMLMILCLFCTHDFALVGWVIIRLMFRSQVSNVSHNYRIRGIVRFGGKYSITVISLKGVSVDKGGKSI